METKELAALAAEFEAAVLRQYGQAVKARYQDERYHQLINDQTAVGTAKDLMATSRIQGMFARMAADRRFDLTIEWLMVQPQFQALFASEELERARQRLQRAGYRSDQAKESADTGLAP